MPSTPGLGINGYRETLAANAYDPARRTVTSVTQMYCGETKAQALRHGGQYTLNYYKFFSDLDRRGSQPSAARGFGKVRTRPTWSCWATPMTWWRGSRRSAIPS